MFDFFKRLFTIPGVSFPGIKPKMPDFKVSTKFYQVENGYEYRLGDTDEYFWKTKDD